MTTLVYTLEAKGPESYVFWFDNRLLQPRGYQFDHSKHKFTIRWQYNETTRTEHGFPDEIFVYRDQNLVESRICSGSQSVNVNRPMAPELFDAELLKRSVP